jgi:BirA family biotin operon repressor/biotin-[acetyl-CoA-carboxylase] ligase
MQWRIFHKKETLSTNTDARAGRHGDVFTADYQTAGRGRLDHKWLSERGENLMMSAVLDVGSLDIAHAATLPLAVGLAAVKTVSSFLGRDADVKLKWPNDVYVSSLKIAGILCERVGDNVIAGVGLNVNQTVFPPEIAARATSLARLTGGALEKEEVFQTVLAEIETCHGRWMTGGFAALYDAVAAVDGLKGKTVCVRQTDGDPQPVTGRCGGIQRDGTLAVGAQTVFAGEAHIGL